MKEEKSTALEALRRKSPPHKWVYDLNADLPINLGCEGSGMERLATFYLN
jgi:hypothetical protein